MAKTTRKTRTAYRDQKTGRFVSRSTWRRSKAANGTRYTRTSVPIGVAKRHVPGLAAPPTAAPGIGGAVPGAIPPEFLEAEDYFFDTGAEFDDETEY